MFIPHAHAYAHPIVRLVSCAGGQACSSSKLDRCEITASAMHFFFF